MEHDDLSKQGLLDILSRQDELQAAILGRVSNIERALRRTGTGPGVISPSPLTDVALQQMLETGQIIPYQIVGGESGLSIATARTNEPFSVQGQQLIAMTDGVLDGITIRFNNLQAHAIPIRLFNPWMVPFWKIYLTNTAQAGRTLYLMAVKDMAFASGGTGGIVTSQQYFYTLRSDKDTHFTGAIALNAKEDENLTGLLANKVAITGVSLQADENLRFRVIFWKTDGFDNTDLDLDTFAGEIDVDIPTYGCQIGGANQYYLDVRLPQPIEYVDEDGSNELHVSLQCVTAAGKSAGAAGEVVLEVYYQPRS